MIRVMDFFETETGFNNVNYDYLSNIDLKTKRLLVKAHEKEIYENQNNTIIAKIHRDNAGVYPFSKLDFLSHKIQELVFPTMVPKILAADFSDEINPYFVVEKIMLDKYHIAYNINRQIANREKGLDYKFDSGFLSLNTNEDITELAEKHIEMVKEIQLRFANILSEKGIAFDHSYVNITWRDNSPVSLEVHKCQRDYLFDYDTCRGYFKNKHKDEKERKTALTILDRIYQLHSVLSTVKF